MKVLFVDVDGTLTETISGATFKSNSEDIRVMDGVENALNDYLDKKFLIVGVSNQGGVPQYKTESECIDEMHNTLNFLPQLHSIIFAPNKGDYCVQVFLNANHYSTECFPSQFVNRSYRKPSWGMLQYFLSHNAACATSELEACVMVGDRPEDEQCAIAANVPFIWAHDWRQATEITDVLVTPNANRRNFT